MKAAYGASDHWREAGGPPARPKPPAPGQKIGIFRPNIYDGAALVLYALRQEIGTPAFERLQRIWVQEHRDTTATTSDFVRLAAAVSGRDLRASSRPGCTARRPRRCPATRTEAAAARPDRPAPRPAITR